LSSFLPPVVLTESLSFFRAAASTEPSAFMAALLVCSKIGTYQSRSSDAVAALHGAPGHNEGGGTIHILEVVC
jgi:hypothetical protein